MPFCPECKAEYEAGIATCTDCLVPLVDVLPMEDPGEPHDLEEGDLVPMRNFANAAEANLVAGLLEENGIRAFVPGGEFTVAPSGFSDEIVLMVDERDLDRAIALYDGYFGENVELPADAPVPEDPGDPNESDGGDQA
jgi:hypothetical protein